MRLFFYSLQLLIAVLFIFYCVKWGTEVKQWKQFSHQTSASLTALRIQGDKKFYIAGTFELPSGKFVDVILKGPFRNHYVAEEEMKQFKDKKYDIWIDGDKALFKKIFPIKTLVTTLLLLALLVYFTRFKKRYHV